MSEAQHYDVIIVGYGPVGQVAANLLGRDGARVAIFEIATSVYNLPRAAHYDAEIMRIFQSIGLSDAVMPSAAPIRGMHFLSAAGEKLFGFDAPEGIGPNGWAAGYMFYQPDLEKALQAGVERFPNVEVHQGHEVLGIEQSAGGITVRVRDLASRVERNVTTDHLWGCDGARSITRRAAGIELEDLVFDQPWLVVDTMLKREVDLPEVAQQFCDPARPVTYVPSAGRHRRWEFMLMQGEKPADMERPENVWRLLAPWVGLDDTEVVRAVVYSFHALIAQDYRRGRIFLLGDAAHQMPPFLGQGMCAGIRDVSNLAWKLDLVRSGIAADSLFDTYQTERAPHVRTIIERAVRAGRIIQTTDPEVAARRDEMFRAAAGKSVTIGQEGGPIESRMPALTGGVLSSATPAGQLFPQSRVTTAGGDEVLLDDVLGSGFALVAGKNGGELLADGACWREVSARCVQVLAPGNHSSPNARLSTVIDNTGVVSSWLDRHGAALVRPDRYVYGVAGSVSELNELSANLRAQLTPR